MKQFVTMKKLEDFCRYQILESVDYKFAAIVSLFEWDFRPGDLIDWLANEKKTTTGNESLEIRKEEGAIALYDVSAWMDETYDGEYLDSENRFEMTVKNFAEVLVQWEQLRVNMPDIILIVIHEDNHVSLETDPVIIKQYQDSGYGLKKSIFAD